MDEQVFNKCSVILFHSLDVSTISPHLVKHQLVTESDSEKLDNPYISDVDKIDYLIQILPRKGNCWLEKFIQCLEETSEGTGHCKIVKELKRAKQDNALVLEFDTIEEGSGQLEATCMGEDSDVVESFTTYTTCTYQYSAYQQEPLFLTPNLLEFHVLGSLSTLNSEKSEMVAEPEMVPVTNQPLTDDASKPIEPEVIQKVDQYEPPDILEETPVVEFPYGQAVDLDITSSDTKPYTVRELEVNEEDLSLDSYEKVEYTETYQGNMFEPIIYTLTDLKDNKHIPGSPFVMHFPTPVDPTKCRVTGLPTVQPQVNSAIRLAMDCTKAGSAKLTVSVESPSGGEEPSKPDVNETSQGQYSIEYTPTVVGVHKLHINWDDQPVPLSPVLLDVASQKFVIFPHGSPISMEIVAGGVKAKDVSAHAIYEPTKEKIKVTVKKGDNKETFKISFKPKHPGIYYVHVFVRHEETSNSPFKVKYSKPYDPSAVKVTVSESEPYFVEEPVKFVVDCTEAGVGELSIRSSGPSSGERQASFNVLDNKDGTYGAVYVPTAPGEHVFDISWSGKAIKDSPLRLHVYGGGAGNVKLVEIPGHSLELGGALCLGFDTTEAGKGNLEAKCVGDNSGQIPCTVEENLHKPKRVDVCFIPPRADIYHVDVEWSSGGHVPGSPFKINLLPPLAENVELTSQLEELTTLEAGVPLDLDFDTSTAGGGVLDVTCVGERVGNVPVSVTPVGEDKYRITFTPTEVDSYKVSVKWSGEHVKGSPFTINMLQPLASRVQLVSLPAKSVESGAPLSLGFDTRKAGEGDMKVTCIGDNSGEVTCTVETDNEDNKRKNVSFIPPQPDIYHLSVIWSGEHIPGSPFKINLLPPVAEKVAVVAEPEAPLETGVSTDLLSFDTSAAGGGKLDAVCVGSNVGEVPVEVMPAGDDKYNISFTPPEPDFYEISVKWGGEHVKGSPFKINMLRTMAEKVKLVLPPSATVETGAPLSLGFDTSKAGEGTMNASCSGEKSGDVDCIVQQDDENSNRLNVLFVPPLPDIYRLSITWSDNHIPGSPFKINLLPPIAENVEIVDKIDSSVVESGVPIDMSFDTSAAGGGQLDAICVGKTVGEVPVKVEAAGEDKYKILFTPPAPDMYEVTVKFGGEHVKGSPFKINMLKGEAAKVKVVSLPSPIIETGTALVFGFDTKEAGSGQLEADCIGQECGDIHCTIRVDGDKDMVCFVPPKEDIFKLNVKWSGIHVPHSPFTLNLLPPVSDNVEMTAEPTIVVEAGVPVEMDFDVSKAGGGTLSATCLGRWVGEVPTEVKPQEDNKYKVQFTPSEADIYELSIKWSGEHIKGSPFKINMLSSGADKIKLLQMPTTITELNKPLSFLFDSSAATAGILHATCVGETVGEMECTVKCKEDNSAHHEITLAIPAADTYILDVTWSNQHVPGSPFRINLKEMSATKTAAPSQPVIYNVDFKWSQRPKDESVFKVILISTDDTSYKLVQYKGIEPAKFHGSPAIMLFDSGTAGRGKLTAECTSSKFNTIPVQVKEHLPGMYQVQFVPEDDPHSVWVHWNGKQVEKSPFSVVAKQPIAEDTSKPEDTVQAEPSSILEETPVQEFVYGQAVDLDITSSGAKLKDITSHAVHEGTQERVKVTVKKLDKEQFRLSLKPKNPGIYNVHVLLNREEIPASPYKIKYCEPFDVKAVRVTLLDSEPYTVGEHIKITVDCKEAGKGDISVKAVGPSFGTKPKCEITDNKDGTYSVLYVPVSTGKHKIEITESGKAVAGTPIKFKVVQNIAERVRLCKPPSSTLDIGSEISLGFDTSKAGDGKMSASCTSEKSGEVTCNVTVRQSESYVNFTPLQPDIYHVDVKWSGVHIPGSPFRINLIPPIANDVKLLAQPKVVSQPEVPVNLEFDTSLAGNGKLEATCQGSRVGEVATEIVPSGDNQCKVSFIPPEPDLYELSVLWSGQHVNGSPFKINTLKDTSTKVKVISLPTATLEYETPLTFAFNVREAETGLMEATCNGENSGEILCKVGPVIDDVIKVTFTPLQPDVYTLIVKWSGVEVTGSPFIVNLHAQSVESAHAEEGTTLQEGLSLDDILGKDSDPSKCKVLGLQEIDAKLYSELTFNVDCQESGNGELTAYAEYPPTAEAQKQVTVDKKDSQMFTISYTPTVSGMHKIHMMWDGQALPNSPITIKVPSEHKSFQHGNAIQFDISSKGMKSKDISAFAVHKPTNEQLPIVVNKVVKDHCRLTVMPKEPGIYFIHVYMKNKELPQSPYIVRYLKPADPDSVRMEVIGKSPYSTGKTIKFEFDCTNAGMGELLIKSSGPEDKPAKFEIKDNEDKTYTAFFTPLIPGDYKFDITWSGKPIPGSPKTISIEEALPAYKSVVDSNKCKIDPKDLEIISHPLEFGKECQFTINAVEAGSGVLNVTSKGPGKADVSITDNKDSTYVVHFKPSIPGKYVLDILWNNHHITGSPHTIAFKGVSSVFHGLDLSSHTYYVGEPTKFKLHCEEVGFGILEVKSQPSSAAKITLRPAEKNIYNIEILPQEVGRHKISVQYSGKHIQGSPFDVEFKSASQALKCKLVESRQGEQQHQVGDAVHFSVSTEEAGEGEITATAEDPLNNISIPVIVEKQGQLYNISFYPGQGTTYLLSVKFDNHHIHGSPFKLTFAASPEAQIRAEGDGLISTQVNQLSTFKVYIASVQDELNVKIHSDKETILPSVQSLGPGVYEVTYTPKFTGVYHISLSYGEHTIPGSPFNIRCYQASDPSKLQIVGDKIPDIMLGHPMEFEVKNLDQEQKGSLTVHAQGCHQLFPGNVTDLSNGIYKVHFIPPEAGKYLLHVRWDGKHIPGSPFKVKVSLPPKPENVKAHGPGLSDGKVGTDGHFKIETDNAGTGTLAVRVHGPKGAFKINMNKDPENDRTILVRYDPVHAGQYTVAITWSDVHIPGSPFTIHIAE